MATARPADDTEYRRLEVVEARMADIVFAAGAIETSYLRIHRITSALARTAMWRPSSVAGVFEMDTDVALSDRAHKLMSSLPDAYYDFHAMLWWGRSLSTAHGAARSKRSGTRCKTRTRNLLIRSQALYPLS
jgi:hypothetical protein